MKKGVRVLELEDFICRCGVRDFALTCRDETPAGMACRACRRRYTVKKLEKKNQLAGLPMTFGFRSLYWDKFQSSSGSLFGVAEEGWEIKEAEQP